MVKKGFTLIELLAVILILGIIALIAIPQVTNVINNASKGAAETSAEHYVGAVNNAITLNKLDTDSSNDIKDGIIEINSVSVDMTGEKPANGTLYIKNGVVVTAELEINGRGVDCDAKGKCKAYDSYVYFNGKQNGITSITEGSETRPENARAYFKYPVIDGELQVPKACVYDDVLEFCISPNLEDLSTEKILSYYGFDKSILDTPGKGKNSIVNIYNSDRTRLCQLEYGLNNQREGILCWNRELSFAQSVNHEYVYIIDSNTSSQWSLSPDGKVIYHEF